VDRRNQGRKRSTVTDAGGIPLGAVSAAANRRDDGLLGATLDTLAGTAPRSGGCPPSPWCASGGRDDDQTCRQVLAAPGMAGEIAPRGRPAPVQATRRWPVERTHAWANQDGTLRWSTERRRIVVQCWLALAAAAIVCGQLVRRAGPATAGTGAPAVGLDHLLAQA
jgi:hypothetical protein